MFNSCTSLINIPNLDTSKGEDFMFMFNDCTSLEKRPNLDLSNVKIQYDGTQEVIICTKALNLKMILCDWFML